MKLRAMPAVALLLVGSPLSDRSELRNQTKCVTYVAQHLPSYTYCITILFIRSGGFYIDDVGNTNIASRIMGQDSGTAERFGKLSD